MRKLTYKKSGVDIKKAEAFKKSIKGILDKTCGPLVLKGIGGFGSLFRFPKGFKEPVLVASSDGVGTKLKLAILANQHDTVGIDAVAMNVNDVLCTGARPLFFLDYIAYSKLKEGVLGDIIKGLSAGCTQAGCALVGGETAQMPGMYRQGEYDLAGFCVGIVERKNIIDGAHIKPGDVVIGLESNGVHANGYSLVRKVFSQSELKRYSKELLKPTRIYVQPVLSLLRAASLELRAKIKGIAHITGGAFYDKIARILPKNTGCLINKNSWPVPKIFRLLQDKGNIEDRQMYHTFNMGVGMVLIAAPKSCNNVLSALSKNKFKSWVIGEVVKGKGRVAI